MAVELAHGGSLDRILAVLAESPARGDPDILRRVTLASAVPATVSQGPAAGSTPEDRGKVIHVDVPVRGVPAARLALQVPGRLT